MATRPQQETIYLLGASGKIGRMFRAIWSDLDGGAHDLIPVFRKPCQLDKAIFWEPGKPFPELPKATAVIALWGVTGNCAEQLAMNSVLALAANDFAKRVGAGRVFHFSSAAIYHPQAGPISEDSEPGPISLYGESKLRMEQDLNALATKTSDCPYSVILRVGNVAGAERLFSNLRPGGTVTLDRFSDGTGPSRSYVAPSDLVRSILCLLRLKQPPRVVNIAAPRPTHMEDIIRAAGGKVEWRSAVEGAVPIVWLDTSKIEEICKMHPDASDAGFLVRDARRSGVWP